LIALGLLGTMIGGVAFYSYQKLNELAEHPLTAKADQFFIVEKGMKGFSIGKEEKKLGIRGSATCELIFEDCIVPKENLLGREGKGFSIAMKTLDGGRIGIASQALGIAQGAMDETVAYTKERKQFGRALSQFQNTQFQLADMQTRVMASRYLVRAAAWKKDHWTTAKDAYLRRQKVKQSA